MADCGLCGGSGQVRPKDRDPKHGFDICPRCEGTGVEF